MTAEEFFEWGQRPENRGRYCELERGQIVDLPRPGKLHGFVCANAAGILGRFAFQQGWGYACSNGAGLVTTRNPDTVRGPDLTFYNDGRTLDTMERGYATEPPLLAVEVLCPEDRFSKVMKRISEYLRLGVPLVWLLDPDEQALSVHPRETGFSILEKNDELTGQHAPAGFRCRVAEFFALPGQDRQGVPASQVKKP